jgi:F-box and WD-40 domain protein 1/11
VCESAYMEGFVYEREDGHVRDERSAAARQGPRGAGCTAGHRLEGDIPGQVGAGREVEGWRGAADVPAWPPGQHILSTVRRVRSTASIPPSRLHANILVSRYKIITGSRDKTIRIWDMHTFECRLIIGPPEVLNDVSTLLDENREPVHYATLCNNQHVAHSMPALVSFPTHHKASILCLQYDDRMLVTGSSDASCIVYNARSGYRPVRRLLHHTAAVLDLTFDDRHIVTCSKDVSICVWDRATGALLRQLRGHAGPVNAVQMRGNTIVSCSGDFKVKLWNIDTGKNIREFVGHTKGLACSQFSEDGRYIASAGNDKVIRIWDANTGEFLREMKAHDGLVRSLHIDSVSGRLVSGSYDTDLKVFDMETGCQLLDFPKWHLSWVLSAKSDYRRIVSTGQDPKILIMDFGADVDGIEVLESGGVGDGKEGYI